MIAENYIPFKPFLVFGTIIGCVILAFILKYYANKEEKKK